MEGNKNPGNTYQKRGFLPWVKSKGKKLPKNEGKEKRERRRK